MSLTQICFLRNDHELQSSFLKGANYPKLRHEEAGRKKRVFSFSVERMFWGPLRQPMRTSCLDCVKISNTTFLKILVRGKSFKSSCWFFFYSEMETIFKAGLCLLSCLDFTAIIIILFNTIIINDITETGTHIQLAVKSK